MDADAIKGIMTTKRSEPRPTRTGRPASGARRPTRHEEAEALAVALGRGARPFGGTEPMRLSVAHTLQPQLAKARSEVEKLRQDKVLLQRQNKMLLLELSRSQQGQGQGSSVLSHEQASENIDAAVASGGDAMPSTTAPLHDVLSWPPSSGDLAKLRGQHRELQTEFRSQSKELASLRRQLQEAEAARERAAGAAMQAEVLRAQLEPLITSLKKDALEDGLWDDAPRLRQLGDAAYMAGIPDHRVAHLITRAKVLENAEAPRRHKPPSYVTSSARADGYSLSAYENAEPFRPTERSSATKSLFITDHSPSAERGGSDSTSPQRGSSPKKKQPAGRRNTPTRLRSEVAASRSSPPPRGGHDGGAGAPSGAPAGSSEEEGLPRSCSIVFNDLVDVTQGQAVRVVVSPVGLRRGEDSD